MGKIMYKLALLIPALCFAGLLQAQTSCSSPASVRKDCNPGCLKSAAARAAAQDPGVEMRADAASGRVVYVRKSVCEATRKTSYEEVAYCQKSGKFVQVKTAARPAAVAKPCPKQCSAPCEPQGSSGKAARNVQLVNQP